MKSPHLLALAFVAAFFSQANAQAAGIIWGPETNITGDSDVSTNGTAVYAYNFGNYTTTASPATNVTINGVTFIVGNNNSVAEGVTHNFDVALGNSPYGSSASYFTGLSSNYQNLLANGIQGGDTIYRTLSLQNLVAGYTYQVQIWVNSSSDIALIIDDDIGATRQPLVFTRPGQYVTGTFIADGTGTQTINVSPFSFAYPTASAQINALQLRQIAVPEPASAMLGGASLGLLALRRRQA